MYWSIGHLLSRKVEIPDFPEIKVGVYLLLHKEDGMFIMLNFPIEIKVEEALPSIKISDITFAGGNDIPDKVYFLHKFKNLKNCKKIARDLYFGGDFGELELLAKHGKVNFNNCRFFIGAFVHDLSKINLEVYKQIGSVQVEEVFLPVDTLQEYWEKIYVTNLLDSSDLTNPDIAESASTPLTIQSFFKSYLWLRSWLILSAIMNAMSLINIGIDLKIVTIRWIEFFQTSFQLIRYFAHTLLYPFNAFFSLFHLEIPGIIHDVFILTFIAITSFARAWDEKNFRFQKGAYAASQLRKWSRAVSYFAKFGVQILTGFGFAIVIAGITWLGYTFIGTAAVAISMTLLCVLFLMMSLPPSSKSSQKEHHFLRSLLRYYLLSIVFALFLICLINYIAVKMVGGE